MDLMDLMLKQVATLVRGSEPPTYYFVGHLYDNLFPIKQIIEHRKKKIIYSKIIVRNNLSVTK